MIRFKWEDLEEIGRFLFKREERGSWLVVGIFFFVILYFCGGKKFALLRGEMEEK